MSKSWDEVRSILDDPYVSADTKELLLVAYAHERGFSDLPDEAYEYIDGPRAQYKINGDEAWVGRQVSTDDIYDMAREESDDTGGAARRDADRVEAGSTDLGRMQPPSDRGSSGAEESDDIFEAARPALRLFRDFLPINDNVPAGSVGTYDRLSFEEDIEKPFDEQMGISFKDFLADADRLREAHRTLSDLNTDSETELNTLYRSWTGPAANSSYQYYSDELAPNIRDLLAYLDTAPTMIEDAVDNIFTACKAKAQEIIEIYQDANGVMGSATPPIAEKVVKLANGDFDSQDEVLEVAAWVDAETGSDLERRIREDDCGLNDENKEYTIRQCKTWIQNSFNADLHDTYYERFKQVCADTVDTVNSHYETLNEYLAEYENKFGTAPPPAVQQPPPTGGETGGGGGGGGTGGGGSGGGGTGGGGSGGGGTGGGGGGGMPSVPTPPPTEPPGGGSQPPGGDLEPPGGDVLEEPTPPSTLPTSPTADQEETVTIQDGDREISVTSPDGEGMVTVTVDDGSGQPKTYTLDFGGPDQTPGTPTPLPGGPPTADGRVIAGFGPDGLPPTVPGMDEPIEPGPDGRCVITDGDLTITAERPAGQPDTVVVTVDDGTGEPTTYNLDYSASATPDGPDGPVTTLPYPASGTGEMPPELVAANEQVDQAVFTPGEQANPPIYAETVEASASFVGDGPLTSASYEEPVPPGIGDSLATEPAFVTTPAAANDPSLFGGSAGAAGSFGAPDPAPSPYMNHGGGGEASLPSVFDAPPGQTADQSSHQSPPGMAGGMPMTGGAPGGGGGSADAERAATQWRTTGDLFDEPADPQRLRGAFGGDDR